MNIIKSLLLNLAIFVLDGPTMDEGQKKYLIYIGDSVTLICGTGLIGNPEPIVTWTPPQAESGASRYVKTEEPNVTLTIKGATESDEGIWKCTVEVNSNDISVACPDPNASSRTRYVEIEVTVIGKLLLILNLNDIKVTLVYPQFLLVNH